MAAAPRAIGRRSQDHDRDGARSPDHPGAAAVLPGGHARAQHPRVSAGEACGDRRALRHRGAGAAHVVRHSRRRIGDDEICDRRALSRQHRAHPQPRRQGRRAQGFPGGRSPAGGGAVLRLPHHGGDRHDHAGDRRRRADHAARRAALPLALVSPRMPGGGAARLRRGDRRLGDDRGRTPAVDGVRPAAHRGIRYRLR